MVEMARIVTDLIDQRGDHGGQAIVFLQIDGEIGRRALADFGQGLAILLAYRRRFARCPPRPRPIG